MQVIYNSIITFLLLTLPSLSGGQPVRQNQQPAPGKNKAASIDTLIARSGRMAEENPDTAFVMAGRALEMAMKINDLSRLSHAARWMAEACYYKNDYRKAIDFYLQSAIYSYEINRDSSGFMAERLTDAAYCYQELGIYDKALELNLASLSIQQRLGNQTEISNNLCNIGTNYFFRAQYDKAVDYFNRTLTLDRKSGDSAAIAISLNNLGMVYSRWGKHHRALEFYTEALELTREESKKPVKLSNIGMAWYNLKDYEKALEYLNQALEIDTKYKQSIRAGVRKNEIGSVLAAMGRYTEAIRLHEEALAVFRSAGILESQIITLADIGDLYRKTGNNRAAETCYKESVTIASRNQSLHHLSRNYKSLFELAKEQGNSALALNYYLDYSRVKDSIFTNETNDLISRYEIIYETEKHEKENQLLLRDNEIKARRQKMLLIFTAGLFLLLIMAVSLFRVRSKYLKQQQLILQQDNYLANLEIARKDTANQVLEERVFAEQQINRLEREKHTAEIEVKNNELANSLLNIVRKNEIMYEIRERIRFSGNGDALNELVRFINSNTDTDHNWKKFRLEFEQVHAGFFDRLKQSYPDLTEHDTRLAACLRINLSSREIAGMMNVSFETAHKNRQRLRKKMNLPPSCDLTTELKKI
ncbi:Photosystem I assembly protein Ycf3 [bioreactor metagenome]|jgi:tetratricopeptide (TPR) repeat protein|uniref:Photosystem I assembly protein Ycf3 n=1 Tax=bioreactor metagenome TaxID=1076179 RepID=A0A644T7X7_9ZZZZ|nr:tetratricopeptide repeat protein [Lentimicrobium sp.]MEA5109265.1 tetratricopeptide repeat protein [Lentimicrobium sp.]